jgi:hypothetical protein
MKWNLGNCGPHNVWQQFDKQPLEKGLYPPWNFPVTWNILSTYNILYSWIKYTVLYNIKLTCSLVVLPLATRTIWNPVNPIIGINNKAIMAIITRLKK